MGIKVIYIQTKKVMLSSFQRIAEFVSHPLMDFPQTVSAYQRQPSAIRWVQVLPAYLLRLRTSH